jgi:hypothetical protein
MPMEEGSDKEHFALWTAAYFFSGIRVTWMRLSLLR